MPAEIEPLKLARPKGPVELPWVSGQIHCRDSSSDAQACGGSRTSPGPAFQIAPSSVDRPARGQCHPAQSQRTVTSTYVVKVSSCC